MANYQPHYLTLAELFERRLFRIPDYQRAYRWESRHRTDLFDDIKRDWKVGKEHFMSTIVGLGRGNQPIIADDYRVIEIVDGQQRITTLVLLFKTIAKALEYSEEPNAEIIHRQLEEMLVKRDSTSMLLLQTNHDTSGFFTDYIRHGNNPSSKVANTLADKNLLDAMKECEEFVHNWQRVEGSLEELVARLRGRLVFVFHEVQDQSEVYSIFEVLNNRGIGVSSLEQLKSMLMSSVFESDAGNKEELIAEIQGIWSDIYRTIGLRERVDIQSLRFSATLRRAGSAPRKPLSESEAVRLLIEQSKGNPPKASDISEWMRSVTESVDDLLTNKRISTVTRISQARLVAVAVKLRTDLTEEEKSRVLRRWENVTFRIYGMHRRDSRTAVGNYVQLAWRITQEKLTAEKILDELMQIVKEYPVEKSVDGLKQQNCYSKPLHKEDLRYFFHRYEEYLAKKAGQSFSNQHWNHIWDTSTASSIEHILPQNSGVDHRHWLGNLTMLPPTLNSKLQDKPPQDKADDYIQTGILVAQDAAKYINAANKWGEAEIIKRENDLLEWAAQEWAD